jgi:hypothetical protein
VVRVTTVLRDRYEGLCDNRASRRAGLGRPDQTILEELRAAVFADPRLTVDRKWWAVAYLEARA